MAAGTTRRRRFRLALALERQQFVELVRSEVTAGIVGDHHPPAFAGPYPPFRHSDPDARSGTAHRFVVALRRDSIRHSAHSLGIFRARCCRGDGAAVGLHRGDLATPCWPVARSACAICRAVLTAFDHVSRGGGRSAGQCVNFGQTALLQLLLLRRQRLHRSQLPIPPATSTHSRRRTPWRAAIQATTSRVVPPAGSRWSSSAACPASSIVPVSKYSAAPNATRSSPGISDHDRASRAALNAKKHPKPPQRR